MKQETASERYLRQATKGLWGRKRCEVREELAGHLAERVRAYRIGGLSEGEATERALAELGAPQFVSRGMVRIHTLPTVMGSSLLLMVLCLAVVALWPKGVAQTLSGTIYWPSEPCAEALANDEPQQQRSKCFTVGKEFWVSQESLQQVLGPQGVTFAHAGGPAVEMLKVSVPGTTPVYIPLSSSEGYVDTVYIDDTPYTKSADYLSLWGLIAKVALNRDTTLRVSGWSEPLIQLNDLEFDLGNGAGRLRGRDFYESYLAAIFNETMQRSLWNTYRGVYTLDAQDIATSFGARDRQAGFAERNLKIAGKSEPEDVYGMITFIKTPQAFADDFEADPGDDRQTSASFLFQVAQPTASGVLPVRLPERLSGQPDFISTFGSDEQLAPGKSILFQLSGGNPQTGGWYEVVSPESVRLEPHRP